VIIFINLFWKRCAMKKIFLSGWIVLLLAALSTPVMAQVAAQEPTPAAESAAAAGPDMYSFPLLGFTETRLIGPFDSTGMQVSFPEEWTYPSSAMMHLDYSLAFFGSDYVSGQA
jgi:hypothetical protein